MTSALTATMIPPIATRNRFDRVASSSSPPGSWLNKPARPLALRTKPMFCRVHFSSARRTATNGPNPDCIPARKRLTPSRPLRLVLEGDASIASDDAVTVMAITFADGTRRSATLILSPSLHYSMATFSPSETSERTRRIRDARARVQDPHAVDEVVRDYPLNVQWGGNRGTITFTHLRARAEPLFDNLFRDDLDRD